ncbi:MAG: hypothetical protein GWO24_05330 [Akkermansiaceae bacterium]|nr:hypothetical protein [Akkermansiaceae bacterium]
MTRLVAVLALVLCLPAAHARLTVAHIFGDNMVIQRDKPIRVWGTATPGENARVRYAWARNPLGNAVNSNHHERIIPIPSFRTDTWDWPEAPFENAGDEARNEHRQAVNRMRDQARRWSGERPILEAKALLEAAGEK